MRYKLQIRDILNVFCIVDSIYNKILSRHDHYKLDTKTIEIREQLFLKKKSFSQVSQTIYDRCYSETFGSFVSIWYFHNNPSDSKFFKSVIECWQKLVAPPRKDFQMLLKNGRYGQKSIKTNQKCNIQKRCIIDMNSSKPLQRESKNREEYK